MLSSHFEILFLVFCHLSKETLTEKGNSNFIKIISLIGTKYVEVNITSIKNFANILATYKFGSR